MTFDAAAVRARREEMLLRLLFRATHVMNAEMARRIRARGHATFQPTFTTLLAHIDTEGTSISELARRVGVSRQAVSQLVRSIELAGFVERQANPSDGRSVIVRHTDTGRRILIDALEVMTMIEDEYSALIGDGEMTELKRLLARLLTQVDPTGTLQPTGGNSSHLGSGPAFDLQRT